ncbi:MAG: RNA methyltransferase [Flavobacteriales bacterium]
MSENLYNVLAEHLTERKRELFDQIVNNRTRHLTLVMEDVYQTQNTSAIVRSLESWGIQDVYAIENRNSFHMHRRIARGAYDWLTFHQYNDYPNNTKACVADLKARGYKVVATAIHEKAVPLHELDITEKTAIVVGTEHTGVSDELLEMADGNVVIPMHGFTESLNVSVASAIIMQHLVQKLRTSNIQWQLSDEEKLALKIEWAKKTIYWGDYLIEMYEKGEINP